MTTRRLVACCRIAVVRARSARRLNIKNLVINTNSSAWRQRGGAGLKVLRTATVRYVTTTTRTAVDYRLG